MHKGQILWLAWLYIYIPIVYCYLYRQQHTQNQVHKQATLNILKFCTTKFPIIRKSQTVQTQTAPELPQQEKAIQMSTNNIQLY